MFSKNVYRHVGMDLHMYRSVQRRRRGFFCSKKEGRDASSRESFSYVIKHSQGTSRHFIWRVARDWKTHMKQTIQRILAIPYAFNFKTNHGPQEHLTRLNQLSVQLEGVYLKELYKYHESTTQSQSQSQSQSQRPTTTTTTTTTDIDMEMEM